jgi:hypothetical protein
MSATTAKPYPWVLPLEGTHTRPESGRRPTCAHARGWRCSLVGGGRP